MNDFDRLEIVLQDIENLADMKEETGIYHLARTALDLARKAIAPAEGGAK